MQSIMQEEEQLYQQQLGGSNTQSGSGMPQQENEQKGDDDDDYGEGSVRCPVCGTTDENYDPSTDTRGDMVQCDGCDMWQHIRCMTGGLDTIDSLLTDDQKYFCDQCDPSRYPHLHAGNKERNEEEVDDEDHDGNYKPPVDETVDPKDLYLEHEPKSPLTTPVAKNKKRSSVSDSTTTTKRRRSSANSNTNSKQKQEEQDNKMRANALKMFIDLFTKFIIPDTMNANLYSLPAGKDISQVATELATKLEKELSLAWFDMENDKLSKFYPERVRSLFANLKDSKNISLKSHVINETLDYAKLVRMNATELANPDLQHFKEKVDTETLNQLIIEKPTKPLYIKTHKGDELIEDINDNNDLNNGIGNEDETLNDTIYARSSISRRHDEEIAMAKEHVEREKHETHDSESEDAVVEEEKEEAAVLSGETAPPMKIKIKYPEFEYEFSGISMYDGVSIHLANNPRYSCFGDGDLVIEGRLSSARVFDYLRQVPVGRGVLLFQLKFKQGDNEDNTGYFKLLEHLLSEDKVVGIKNKENYEKNIYLIPCDNKDRHSDLYKLIAKGQRSDEGYKGLLDTNARTFFLVVVVKPELI